MQYRRWRFEGGTYFFTVVTYGRKPFLTRPDNLRLLRQSFKQIKEKLPFKIIAIVILPDHLHCLWILPPGDADFSKRWRLIKSCFSRRCFGETDMGASASRRSKREKAVWQRRFWEHLIKDDEDLAQHLDYIHFNPVKHGYVRSPRDWPHSSFHWFLKNGYYSEDFGDEGMQFGEEIGGE